MMSKPCLPKSRTVTARVISLDDVSSDVRVLRLELENKTVLDYHAGQYAYLTFDNAPTRPYSIANAPGGSVLEFHIKGVGSATDKGASYHATHNLSLGDSVKVDAPHGTHIWRNVDRPVLLLAGGVGIAPMKAITEAALHNNSQHPLYLYWGVRNSAALYLEKDFRKLAAKHAHFHFIPLLSETPDNRLRSGTLAQALEMDFDTLSGYAVFMAGPTGMVEATAPFLLDRGLEKDFLFCDSFG